MPAKSITLALQGGGSHGAFTWGVLDQLLEDERMEVEGISGASAGGVNAVVLAHGVTAGGREGGRQALKAFWLSVAAMTPPGLVPRRWAGRASTADGKPHPSVDALLLLTKFLSPYQLNPLDLNPLRGILDAQVDFGRLRAECRIKLFIAATQVATGEPRVFTTSELTLDTLLASACLPSFNHPVAQRIEQAQHGRGVHRHLVEGRTKAGRGVAQAKLRAHRRPLFVRPSGHSIQGRVMEREKPRARGVFPGSPPVTSGSSPWTQSCASG